jgi:hypothetical protein
LWQSSAIMSSTTSIVGKPFRKVMFSIFFFISSNSGWWIPKQYIIFSAVHQRTSVWDVVKVYIQIASFPPQSEHWCKYLSKVRKETPWLSYLYFLSYSYILLVVFNVGLGKVYPMALLSNVIYSLFFPFCRDKFTMDVIMITYTTIIWQKYTISELGSLFHKKRPNVHYHFHFRGHVLFSNVVFTLLSICRIHSLIKMSLTTLRSLSSKRVTEKNSKCPSSIYFDIVSPCSK